MTTAISTALPFAEAFEETWNGFFPWIQTPRNRALFEAAWRTPFNELFAVTDCFESAGESWNRDSGEVQQGVWDAFIEGDNSSYGRDFQGFSVITTNKRPGDVDEDGNELPLH